MEKYNILKYILYICIQYIHIYNKILRGVDVKRGEVMRRKEMGGQL